jgi:hypothetical protein
MTFFTELEKVPKFIWIKKRSSITKAILSKKRNVGDIKIPI